MINIGIVDDHQLFLDGIHSILSPKENINVIFTENNAKVALQLIQKKPLDILITDISMPEMSGLELINQVRQLAPKIKIIVMSSFQGIVNHEYVDAYLLKNTPKEILIEVISNLHYKNERYYYSAVKEFQDIQFKKNILSSREKEIVVAIGQGYSSSDISKKLFISINTVETHRKNIFFKLNVTNIAQLVSTAIKLGIIN